MVYYMTAFFNKEVAPLIHDEKGLKDFLKSHDIFNSPISVYEVIGKDVKQLTIHYTLDKTGGVTTGGFVTNKYDVFMFDF